MNNNLKVGWLNCSFPQYKWLSASLLTLSLVTNTVFAETPSSLKKILLPVTQPEPLEMIKVSNNNKTTESTFFLIEDDNIDQSRPGLPSNPPPDTPKSSGQTRPGLPSNPPPDTPKSSGQTRPGLAQSSGPLRPGLGGTVGLRPGLSLSRPGLSAISRPGLERSQVLGVQQVGEASAQATRRIITASVKTGPEAVLDEADRLVDKREFDKAISKYQQLIKDNPNFASAYAGLGYAYIQIEDFDVAVETLKIAVEKNKNDQEAQRNLGVALYRGGNIPDAINQYKSLIDSKTADAEVYFNLGIAYAHEGDFDNAVTQIEIAIKRKNNKYPEAYNNLGLIYEAKGDDKKAIELFESAIKQQNGNNPLAMYNLARIYLGRAGSREAKLEAIEQYKKAIKHKPNFPEAYLDMGNAQIYLTVHSVDSLGEALKAYQEALGLRKGIYPLAYENMAITYSKMGKIEEAIKHYYMAFEQYDGRCPEALHNLVTTLSEGTFTISNELLQANNAASLTNKNRKKFNENNNKTQEIDDIFFRTMKNLLTYEDIDEKKKDNPLIRYCGARAYAFVGDWRSATSEFISAIELAKKDPKTNNKTVGTQQINVVEDAERALITITSNNLVAMLP
jgi:tetratricopeptide (TPR) repeat protein